MKTREFLFDQAVPAFVPHTVVWDVTNHRGERVSSGIYVLRAVSTGLSRTAPQYSRLAVRS